MHEIGRKATVKKTGAGCQGRENLGEDPINMA